MVTMRILRLSIPVLFFSSLVSFASDNASAPLPVPRAFAGWVQSSAPSQPDFSTDQQALLHEFRIETATLTHYEQNGRTLDLSVIRFPDYTDAYGAFTFWREPNMLPQKIGDDAASGDNRVVFFRGNILVDARFDRVTAMTLSQLRDLSRQLPVSKSAGNAPTLPKYIPQDGLAQSSVRYAIGPVGLRLSGATVDNTKIRFDLSPEIVTGAYRTNEGVGLLTLISYPTPQIAGDQLRAIEPGWVQSSLPGNQIKRTHSIDVLTSGQLSSDEAKVLLASVNYDADLTWNEATKPNPRDNVLGLLSGAIILSGILVGIMFIFGFFFGGFRILYFKLKPEKQAAYEESRQMIRLNLR